MSPSPSPSQVARHAERLQRRTLRALAPLLLWAAHFFASYVALAIGCRAAEAGADAALADGLRNALIGATLVAIVLEAVWLATAWRRRAADAGGIGTPLVLGGAALSIVAMAWLLAAVAWLPVCRAL